MKKEIGIFSFIWRVLLFSIVIGGILFLISGTFRWVEVWIYLFLQIGYSGVVFFYLKKTDKELLRKRLDTKMSKRKWDKIVMLFFYIFTALLFILPAIDRRFSISKAHFSLEIVSFILIFFGFLIMFLAMRENTFLSRNVEIQKSRKHKVITTGVYSFVRHPMYLGAILFMFFLPLALGSYLGLIPGLLLSIVIIIRTSLEDKTLQKELKGYKKYAEETRYKLVPSIW